MRGQKEKESRYNLQRGLPSLLAWTDPETGDRFLVCVKGSGAFAQRLTSIGFEPLRMDTLALRSRSVAVAEKLISVQARLLHRQTPD